MMETIISMLYKIQTNKQISDLPNTFLRVSINFLLGTMALVFTIMMREIWAKIFTDESKIIALTSLILPIVGLCELGNCPQTTLCGALRGTARPEIGAIINFGLFLFSGYTDSD